MLRDYPVGPSSSFYATISKDWHRLATSPDKPTRDTWENTCAARMSYALNRNGVPLGTGGGRIIPDNSKDKYNYWYRVSELSAFLKRHFGRGDLEHIPAGSTFQARKADVQANVLNKISGKKGIVVFEVAGWSNASGHFTLWNGSRLLYAPDHDNPADAGYYFWFAQTTKIIFGS